MKQHEQFELTLNPQDLRDLYRDGLHFKFFSRENRIIIATLLIALFLSIYFLAISEKMDRHLIYSLIFISLFANQSRSFYLHYRKFRDKSELLENWIQSLVVYSSHRIEFDEMSLVYLRDNEKHNYDLNNIKSVLRNDSFLYLQLMDDNSLILPKKAFKEGDFKLFLEYFDTRVKS